MVSKLLSTIIIFLDFMKLDYLTRSEKNKTKTHQTFEFFIVLILQGLGRSKQNDGIEPEMNNDLLLNINFETNLMSNLDFISNFTFISK